MRQRHAAVHNPATPAAGAAPADLIEDLDACRTQAIVCAPAGALSPAGGSRFRIGHPAKSPSVQSAAAGTDRDGLHRVHHSGIVPVKDLAILLVKKELELQLPVPMHVQSQDQAQNGKFMVKNDEFTLLSLTLPTRERVEIFKGGRKILGGSPRPPSARKAVSRQPGARAPMEAMSGRGTLTEFRQPGRALDVPARTFQLKVPHPCRAVLSEWPLAAASGC